MKMSKYFGPSTLVAAAFIGPGTVTTCTIAGVTSGYSLLWALVFSIIATLVLQEMSARVGWVTREGLGEALSNQFDSGLPRLLVFVLVIGATTVVPYNLFLHASTISKKWSSEADLKDIRRENNVSIILGGFISMLIIITAATTGSTKSVTSASDLAIQLEPVFGVYAKQLMGIGLLAAGCSSALTAPLAAAYAAQGLFGWDKDASNWKFRLVWMTILITGILIATTGLKPIIIIKFAQITNAILLPLIAIYLILISNSRALLGEYVNKLGQNILAACIIVITISLSLRSLNNVLHIF